MRRRQQGAILITRSGFALLLILAAVRGQDVPLPPKPPEGPSLEVTAKYIQENLNAQEKLRWLETRRLDNTDPVVGDKYESRYEYTVAAATDTPKCTVSWQEELRDFAENTPLRTSYDLSFRETAKIVVESYADYMHRRNSNVIYEESPKILILRVVNSGKTVHIRSSQGNQEGKEGLIYLQEEEIAGRLAKAMVHAVELCGGGDKDPFK